MYFGYIWFSFYGIILVIFLKYNKVNKICKIVLLMKWEIKEIVYCLNNKVNNMLIELNKSVVNWMKWKRLLIK